MHHRNSGAWTDLWIRTELAESHAAKLKALLNWIFSGYFHWDSPGENTPGISLCMSPSIVKRSENSGQQIWWNFKTRSWKNGQGVLEYPPTRNLCSGSQRRSWSSWTKNDLPMGRSIWKVDGRDSENLQKKRYVAWKLVFMSMKNLKKNIHLISMRQIVDFLKYILLRGPIFWSPIRGTR